MNSLEESPRFSQDYFKFLVHSYFNQLTKGCDDEHCMNPFCCKNPNQPRLEPNAAAALALEWAMAVPPINRLHFNVAIPSSILANSPLPSSALQPSAPALEDVPSSFCLSDIETAFNEAQASAETGDAKYRPVIRLVGAKFGNDEVLETAFLHPFADLRVEVEKLKTEVGEEMLEGMTELLRLNREEVNRAFNRLIPAEVEGQDADSEPTSAIKRVLATATDNLLSQLSYYRFDTAQKLRPLLIMLENPLLMDVNYHQTLVPRLTTIITRLPSASLALLRAYWRRLFLSASGQLERLAALFQHFITMRVFAATDYVAIHRDSKIVGAITVLAILVDLNVECGGLDDSVDTTTHPEGLLVDPTLFYNDALNENLMQDPQQMRDNYIHFYQKDTTSTFTLLAHPFLLTAATKARFLMIESVVSQQLLVSSRLRSAISRGESTFTPYLVLNVRRDHLVQDTLNQLSFKKEALKAELKLKFVGEEGVDEGGPKKEFFQLIVREIFDPKYGMFECDETTRMYWFKSHCVDCDAEYEMIGIIIGLAIYNSVILDLHFPPVLFKKLLNQKVSFNDLLLANPSLGKSLKFILDTEEDVGAVLDTNFTVDQEVYGNIVSVELKENGANIPLTNDNRQEYVRLFTEWYLNKSVEQQFSAFKKGFDSVAEGDVLKLFSAHELELLVVGGNNIDFAEMRKTTKYDGYTDSDEVVQWLWEILEELPLEQKKRFLFFATGSDRVPINGLGDLRFIVVRHGEDTDNLPTAHTCFNALLLPQYGSKAKLERLLKLAIENAEGFGLL